MDWFTQMIPKIIHYCWFGHGQQPQIVKQCISSWKAILPNFKFVLWDENSFDVNSSPFTKIAYENKKWAFVSDYVRLYALKKYGGVYLDTDVEVLKDFSCFLKTNSYLSSFQEGGFLSTCFFACEPNHPFINAILQHYDSKKWQSVDLLIMNPIIFTKIAIEKFDLNNANDSFFNDIFSIYPLSFFTPARKSIFGKGMKKFDRRKYLLSKKNTYVIHHELGSWSQNSLIKKIIVGSLRIILPYRIYNRIKKKRARKLINGYALR